MKLKQVRVDLVDVPAVRVTAQYDEEHLKLLTDSLAAMGTVNPIILVQTGERYQVVDGLHRWEEAKVRGDQTIPSVVYEGGPGEALLMNLVLNRVRGKVKASEMVAVIKALWQDHGLDSDTIATKTGLSRDYIEKLQRISLASPGVQEALDREVIGVSAAYEIARLPRQEQQEELVAKYQIWRFKIAELRQFINEILRQIEGMAAQPTPAQPQARLAPPQYYCDGCKKETPLAYLRAVPLCPDCFGAVWRLARGAEPSPVAAEDKAPPP